MKNRCLNFVLWAGLLVPASASLHAQVFEGKHTKTISTVSKKHIYIENRMVGLDYLLLSQNHIRLTMLADLISSENAPPNLLAALKLAVNNADITIPTNDEIQIIQKDLSGADRTILEAAVEISNFTGNASGLLHGLSLLQINIEVDRTFALGGPIPDSEKLDCRLTRFSFKGTLRDLLKTVAKKRDALGGYVLMVGKDLKLSVKFIP